MGTCYSCNMNICESILEHITDYKYGVFNSYWWKDFWYHQISSRINPRNKWLTKQIPRTWVDKDTILEISVIGSLKHYVEGEEALGKDMCHFQSSQDDPTFPEWQKESDRQVKHYYELATQKLVALEKELAAEWDAIPTRTVYDLNKAPTQSYEEIYGKVNRLEQEVYDLQTEIMVWVVKNRNILWT